MGVWRGLAQWHMVCVAVLFFCSLRNTNGQWTLDDFAQEFCSSIASFTGVSCDCVDTLIIPGQGKNLCGYKSPLGPGFQVQSSTFTGWQGDNLTPNSNVLIKDECDARGATSNNVGCTATGAQTVTSSTTTSYTVGLGLQVTLGFSVPGLVDDQTQLSFTFEHTSSTENGNSVTASDTCGPPSGGQAAGTCTVYTEMYNSYSLGGGRTFTYDAVVSGGVQMSFGSPIDANAAVGHEGDGSSHYYWYFAIDEMVSYGQSSLSKGNMANMNQFDTPNSNSFGNPVTFHGSGDISGQFLDVSTVCQTSGCP